MVTYVLPPDTRAVNTGNPPADMNAVVDVLTHSSMRTFWLDIYGADPTGATLSDAAWAACYADAAAAIITGPPTSGALIAAGPGVYKFSVDTAVISDQRIGLLGAGKGVTEFTTSGSGGSLIKASGGTSGGSATAPVGGFSLYGYNAGANTNGLMYGARNYGNCFDIDARGFQGSGSRGFWFGYDGMCENSDFWGLTSRTCTVGYCFTGNAGVGSMDYSRFNLGAVSCGTMLQIVNDVDVEGVDLVLHGNLGGGAGAGTATVLQVGASGTDTSFLNHSRVAIGVEANAGSTTIQDFVIQGAAGNSGIWDCKGIISMINAGGTFVAGSNTSRMSFWGPVIGSPLVNAMTTNQKWTPFGSRILGCNSTL